MFDAEMLASAIRMTTPVMLTALGAVYTERGGVVNIGLEGMMIVGSFWGAWGALNYGPVWGILLGVLAGFLLSLIHAVASVTFRVDQIVSGVALNLLAYGLARFSSILLFGMATTSPHVPRLADISVPYLRDVAWLRPLVTGLSPVILIGFALVILSHYVLGRTVFGLRLRSVGENPLAADSLGINVLALRYTGCLMSGILGGLAGAYLSVEHTGMYIEGMTQGKGFIALAAMIFGNWTPLGAMGASMLFGFAEALSFRVVAANLPYQFIKMIPYALTLVVLTGVVRRAVPPAADGIPYARGGE
ncbi:MAG: ABC transporter permease [Acetobacteraceae bacterium]|nr:ABC transporter permease [Acetobacteraceae bacterium]